jgi:hypothetical protein
MIVKTTIKIMVSKKQVLLNEKLKRNKIRVS